MKEYKFSIEDLSEIGNVEETSENIGKIKDVHSVDVDEKSDTITVIGKKGIEKSIREVIEKTDYKIKKIV